MKPLALASLLVGLLAVLLQAQAQGVEPLQFNGLYFDPPAQDHYVAPAPARTPSVRLAPRGPSYGPGIDTFDANAPR